MKKKLLIALSLSIALLLLVSCAASMTDSNTSSFLNTTGSGGPPGAAPQIESAYDDYGKSEMQYEADMAYPESAGGGVSTGSGVSLSAQTNVSFAEKIIYSATANIETVTFDDTITQLGDLISLYSAFVESSYESGADYASKYYGYNAYRTANYVVRVPRESFSALVDSLPALGHVTSKSTNGVNVTEQYTDVESRLTVYRTEESRLLAMLEKCDTVADMITIESTLSNVRYEIESLTSRLKNLDNQVNYSSLTLSIREVEELTPTTQTHRTYGQQISDGLSGTLRDIGNFFKALLKFLVVNSPIIAVIIVIVVVVIFLLRRNRKRRLNGNAASDETEIK